jgi:hypothetical protein
MVGSYGFEIGLDLIEVVEGLNVVLLLALPLGVLVFLQGFEEPLDALFGRIRVAGVVHFVIAFPNLIMGKGTEGDGERGGGNKESCGRELLWVGYYLNIDDIHNVDRPPSFLYVLKGNLHTIMTFYKRKWPVGILGC